MTHKRYTPIPRVDRNSWFETHYGEAAGQIVDFFAGDGVSLSGRRVADVGCGDGCIDLGVAHLAGPDELIGFDLVATDRDLLQAVAADQGVPGPLPNCLEFRLVEDEPELPCDDGYFDYMFSWSVFEHVADPIALVREMRRALKPTGVLMIQVWPFLDTEHGSHLAPWFPEGFAQLRYGNEELEQRVRSDPGPDPEWAAYLLELLPTLNGVTLDDLQRAVIAGGFTIGKVELLSNPFHVPPGLGHLPLSRLGISGVKLLAGIR